MKQSKKRSEVSVINDAILTTMDNTTVRITLISNIFFEPYFQSCLSTAFSHLNINIQVTFIAFSEYKKSIEQIHHADIVIVGLNFDEMYHDAENLMFSENVFADQLIDAVKIHCKQLYATIRQATVSPILWLGFEDYCYKLSYLFGTVPPLQGIIDQINTAVYQMVTPQDTFIDLKCLIAQVGIFNAFESKGKYRWNAPYSKALVDRLGKEIYKQYLIKIGKTKKCLVLDCDNVLWSGILSDDGIDCIYLGSGLGRSHQDFQRFLLSLYYHGVILTICSKNDETDVLKVFREHSGMILKEEYIACFQVNWDNKPDNIKKIAEKLNIGLDSMVFVDDSEFEIHAVQEMLPEVTTILYDRDSVYEELSCFNLQSNIDLEQIKWRNETYQTNTKRENLKSACKSFKEYISELKMTVDIHKVRLSELSRMAELTQRTNKCTNGVRYSVDQLKLKMQTKEYTLYSVSVSDRFSNLGIVGVIGICGKTINVFALSCRSLGRGVEDDMITFCQSRGVSYYQFASTTKNRDLYDKLSHYFLAR